MLFLCCMTRQYRRACLLFSASQTNVLIMYLWYIYLDLVSLKRLHFTTSKQQWKKMSQQRSLRADEDQFKRGDMKGNGGGGKVKRQTGNLTKERDENTKVIREEKQVYLQWHTNQKLHRRQAGCSREWGKDAGSRESKLVWEMTREN